MIKRTLYFGNPYYLSFKQKQLQISNPQSGEVIKTIPIEDIALLMLDHGQITVTNYLLQELAQANVAVVTCSPSHMPIAMFIPFDGHNIQTARQNTQLNASLPLKKQLWTQTVKAKITNQSMLLKKLGKDNKPLEYILNDVKLGDEGNAEGRAAKAYWQTLFSHLCFKREREGVFPNAHLNYCYAVLRAIVARALVSSGMLPGLGIFHRNQYNAYCLADDIMEPYRIYCDALVHDLFINNEITDSELDTKQKAALLSIATHDVMINGKKSPLLNAVSYTTSSLYECYAGNRRKIIYPVF